jgi:hypothetical protein
MSFYMCFPFALTDFGEIRHSKYSHILLCSYEFCGTQSLAQWPRGLRRRSADARLLRLWVRLAPGAWMSVCCKLCALSGRGLFDELITRPEEYYRLWFVVVCVTEISWMRRLWPTGGLSRQKQTEQTNKAVLDCGHKWNLHLFSTFSSSLEKMSYGRYPPQFIDVIVVVIGAVTAILERKRISTLTVHI